MVDTKEERTTANEEINMKHDERNIRTKRHEGRKTENGGGHSEEERRANNVEGRTNKNIEKDNENEGQNGRRKENNEIKTEREK